MDIQDIRPEMMVHAKGSKGREMQGIAGVHVGTVDHLDGSSFIKLNRRDSPDGKHHWIPVEWVERIDAKAVYLSRTPDEFKKGLLNDPPKGLH